MTLPAIITPRTLLIARDIKGRERARHARRRTLKNGKVTR